jgi:hypothetical protein
VKLSRLVDSATTYGSLVVLDAYQTIAITAEIKRSIRNCEYLIADLVDESSQIKTDEDVALSYNEAINYLKDFDTEPKPVNVEKQPPFAEPLFRTKRNSAAQATCDANGNTTIDFELSEERYVAGGFMLIENAQFGDYVVAQLVDADEDAIPEAYRAALCESWPIVAEYISKEWIHYVGNTYTLHKINTKPLNAKIAQGLYLRVKYYAVNSGSQRKILTTYDLTKKL